MFLEYAYYDGEILPLQEVQISPTDLSIHRGYSIFDFLKIIDRNNPWLDLYLDRLYRSALAVHLELKETRSSWTSLINSLLDKNDCDDAFLKIIVSAGHSVDGYNTLGKSRTLIACSSVSSPSADIYESGGKLISRQYRRDLPGIKTTNYLYSASIADQMKQEDVIDVLYHWDGKVSECSRCNFFIVKNGIVSTAKDDILHGITRHRVLDLKNTSTPIVTGDISIDDITQADEAFITSTTKGVLPITQIDDVIISSQVGAITGQLMSLINDF